MDNRRVGKWSRDNPDDWAKIDGWGWASEGHSITANPYDPEKERKQHSDFIEGWHAYSKWNRRSLVVASALVFLSLSPILAYEYLTDSDAASFAVSNRAAGSEDFVVDRNTDFDSRSTFHGYECTVDCSGHEAGYAWAEENGITDPGDCGGNSQSFIEGCIAYTE